MTERLELTDDLIRNYVMPKGRAEEMLRDSVRPGLALRVRAEGGRSWVFLYRTEGDAGTQKYRIGAWPKVRVDDARHAARLKAGQLLDEIDPNKVRREKAAAKRHGRRKPVPLGSLILRDPITDHPSPYETSLIKRQYVNVATAMSALRRGFADHLKIDVKDLKLRPILDIVEAIEKTGKAGAASDFRKHTNLFLEWVRSNGYGLEHNVLAGYRKPKSTRAQSIARRTKGRALTDEEIVKVWAAAGKMGAFGLLTRTALLGGARRGEPARITWKKHVMADRITFDERWTKMGLHHDVPRTPLLDTVLDAAKHFELATCDLVFPGRSGTPISGFTKLVSRLIDEADVAKFTMHDLRRTLRTIMSKCGYDDPIQRMCVGQKVRGIDAIYNKDDRWIIRKMAFEAAHDYIAELVGEKRAVNVVRLRNDPVKTELLNRLREFNAAA